MKTLIIINGVTGAIGVACLARFSREHSVTIYGLSRKALNYSAFTTNNRLPDNTLICSIGDITKEDSCYSFIKAINFSLFKKVIYIHAVGVYPFEINLTGNIEVSNDKDGDGIDDRTLNLSYKAFFAMVNSLRKSKARTSALIFGGIADKYRPIVHRSWWTVMEEIKLTINKTFHNVKNMNFFLLNISSVICPHEILTRPFVFQNTNADPRFWLEPHEVAEEVAILTLSNSNKHFVEQDLFHNADYYQEDYFENKNFTERKIAELGIDKSDI